MTTKTMKKVEHGILIEALVTIKQGERIIAQARNHWVDQGLRGLISQIITGQYTGGASGGVRTFKVWWGANTAYPDAGLGWQMYLGQDIVTVTTPGMTVLTTPIGGAPGTAPNSRSNSVKDGSADGIWNITYIATWNPGTVSGTLGELGLYMGAVDNATFQWVQTGGNPWKPANVMVSRLSGADGDFSSFIIDDTMPLTVEWTVQLSFV